MPHTHTPQHACADGELRQPGPDIMRKLSGAKDKLSLRVHGLIIGRWALKPKRKRWREWDVAGVGLLVVKAHLYIIYICILYICLNGHGSFRADR
jgi:hypothetical protein